MASIVPFPGASTPADRAIEALRDRGGLRQMIAASVAMMDALGEFTNEALAVLDAFDGDPDIEPNGDETDGNAGEDEFMSHGGDGPGCPIADPDRGVEDVPHDGDEGQ